jgi:hypothetical protein
MIRFLLLLTAMTATKAQMPVPMGICYHEDAKLPEVQIFCQNVPDCMYSEEEPESENCYMRCQDQLDDSETEWNCEAYGMKCHLGVICILPPTMEGDDGFA